VRELPSPPLTLDPRADGGVLEVTLVQPPHILGVRLDTVYRVAWALGIAGFALFLVVMVLDLADGDATFVAGTVLAVVAVGVLVLARQLSRRPRTRIRFAALRLQVGAASIPWSEIADVQQAPDGSLVIRGREASGLRIPAAALEDDRAWLLAAIRAGAAHPHDGIEDGQARAALEALRDAGRKER
jgi:hypothetical protein